MKINYAAGTMREAILKVVQQLEAEQAKDPSLIDAGGVVRILRGILDRHPEARLSATAPEDELREGLRDASQELWAAGRALAADGSHQNAHIAEQASRKAASLAAFSAPEEETE